ncbi:CBS domain-containing protein [bacterium]|nr:CBS domain-containing protein [bacterium]
MMLQLKEVLKRSIVDLSLSKAVPGCSPAASVEEATKLLQGAAGTCILVLDQKKAVGIFTERDVLKKVTLSGVDAKATPVSKLMTPNPVSVTRQASVGDVLMKMKDGKFRHLVVADAYGNSEGVVSMRDITDYLANLVIQDHANP